MNYNTPEKRVTNFSDYCDNIDKEKEDLKDIKRSMKDNHVDTQQYTKNSKYKFNYITRKMNDMTKDIVDDTLDNLED